MKKFIYPYKQGSKSVKKLKEVLAAKVILVNGKSKFKGGSNTVVINWGSSKETDLLKKSIVLNKPECVAIASNKKKFFEVAKKEGVNIPNYTEDLEEVESWVNEGKIVFAREKLQGHSGDGIVIIEDYDKFSLYNKSSKAKIFTEYIPKKFEYRVHVVKGVVIDVQQKVIKKGLLEIGAQINWKVRSHKNGFIYKRENVKIPQEALDQAVKAVKCCGLDFGAVDIIYNDFRKKSYVLEINTAPGLEGTSLDKYTKALDGVINNPHKIKSHHTFNVDSSWVTLTDQFVKPKLTESPKIDFVYGDDLEVDDSEF